MESNLVFSWLMSCCGDPSNALKNTPPLWPDTGLWKNLTFGSGWSLWTWAWDSVATQTPTCCNPWHFAKDWKVGVAPLAIWVERLLKRWCSYHVLGVQEGNLHFEKHRSVVYDCEIITRRFFLNKSRIRGIGEIIRICHCWIEWKRSVIS